MGYHPGIPGDKRERHRVNGCCSCCCAPGQRASECQCCACYCSGSEQGGGLFDHPVYPTAVRGITITHLNVSTCSPSYRKHTAFPFISHSTTIITITDSSENKDQSRVLSSFLLVTFIEGKISFKSQSN